MVSNVPTARCIPTKTKNGETAPTIIGTKNGTEASMAAKTFISQSPRTAPIGPSSSKPTGNVINSVSMGSMIALMTLGEIRRAKRST